jgi:hypothetical protein
VWAAWAVDALHYLADLDADIFNGSRVLGGHHVDTVEIAHARWAAGTAMTALDLCAATIGALHLPRSQRAYDILDLDQAKRRASLCKACTAWLDGVISDPDYSLLKDIRNPLTHSTMPRILAIGGAAPAPEPEPDLRTSRTRFKVTSASAPLGMIQTQELIERGREVSGRHVLALLKAAKSGAL